MPELPEVMTTIAYLKKYVLNKTITKVWFDQKTKIEVLDKSSLSKNILNQKFTNITNVGKYILFTLSNNHTLIIHQKLSGHLLFGKFNLETKSFVNKKDPLSSDPKNQHIRFVIQFQNNNSLVLSDLRRFASITLVKTKDIYSIKALKTMGINPFEKDYTFPNFVSKLKNHKINIKKALLDQTIISGLGNIYSDEVLFKSKILPLRNTNTLSKKELQLLFTNIKTILKKAVESSGTSFDNYRTPEGTKGEFSKFLKVYGRKNQPCKICKKQIKMVKINGRSSCYCPNCQH